MYSSRVLLIFFAALAVAQGVRADREDSGIPVTIRTVAPDLIEGQLIRFSLTEGAVLWAGGQQRRIPFDQIVRIDATGEDAGVGRATAIRSRSSSDLILLDLRHGDWLIARPGDADDDRCKLTLGDRVQLSIPLDAITAFRPLRKERSSSSETETVFHESSPGDEDSILLTNGDVIHGFILKIEPGGVTLENTMGEVVVPFRLIVGAKFAAAQPIRPTAQHVVIHLVDGGRLTCSAAEWSGDGVAVQLSHGPEAKFATDRITRVDVIGGRWSPLSSLQPLTFEHTPMLSLHWKYRTDTNVLDSPMQVSGRSFQKGLGVHSRSRLSFELKGQFVEFVTQYGLDDSGGPLADVDVSILVDGTTRYEKRGVRAGTLSNPVRIDVRDANRIELVVDFGQNGDVQDRFNWVEPGLIR